MEVKIKKWSKILKWLLVSALVWYGIGIVVQLPDFLASEKWTIEYATQDIIQQLDSYIDTEASSIILKEDAVKQHLVGKSYYLYGRIAEIIFNMIIFIMGFVITRKLSKEVGFDIIMDFYRLGCGIAIILLAYVLSQGQFLQEEYDTTL